MIPTLKKIGEGVSNILEVLNEDVTHFYPYWHYHPWYEIMLIEKELYPGRAFPKKSAWGELRYKVYSYIMPEIE